VENSYKPFNTLLCLHKGVDVLRIAKIPEAEKITQQALKKALKSASSKHGVERERAILLTFYKEIRSKLSGAIKSVPRIESLDMFKKELIDTLIGVRELKRVLAHFNKSLRIISKLKKEYIYRLSRVKTEREARKLTNEFLGRSCSVIKKLKRSIELFNGYVVKLKEMPDIKPLPTLLIAGCPNVGKTTLLNKITGSKAKIASYAFTTTRLNLGYATSDAKEMQVIDTPGLLDRKIEEMNRVERKAIIALKHLANAIAFVLDPTESSYMIDAQRGLLTYIKKTFNMPIIVVISKVDIANEEQVALAKKIAEDLGLEWVLNNNPELKAKLVEFCLR
jgi:nucleolar GTP-binding protein